MKKEYCHINKKISDVQRKIDQLPEGKLICARNGKYIRWFWSDGHTKKSISKKNRCLAEQLASKKYYSLLLEDLLNEKEAIQLYLNKHQKGTGKAEKLLIEESEYKNLLSSHFKSLSEELSIWMNSPYEQSKKYPEGLVYKGMSGNMLRSKSEVIIDMHLCMNKIPYRYEAALNLNGIVIYPDFTIRHPKTGKTYYWEHFGMADNIQYARNAGNKLQLYMENRIVPSIQLITTFETKDHPLDSKTVEQIIQQRFL